MPTGAPNFIVDKNANTAGITNIGQVKTNEVFDTIKPSYHESMTAASGGTQLADMQVGKLFIQSLSGNGVMYVGGVDTDAPFSGRGILLFQNAPPLELPISNANKVSICATVSGQLVTYWGFINSDNIILDPNRQGVAPDVEAPSLLSSIPFSGAGNIPVADITLLGYFNESLLDDSVNTSSVIVRQSGVAESQRISGTVELFDNIVAFEPADGQLQYASWYTANYTPLISDLAGNTMLNSASYTFMTMQPPDTSGPVFLSSDPIANESGTNTVNQTIAAFFNEALDPLSIDQSSFIVRLSGAAATTMVSGQPGLSLDQLSARLAPVSGQLAFTSWYNAYVTADITDLAGNPTNSTSFAFLTAAAPDTSGPIYLSSNPVSGSTGVSTNGVTFFAYFNEPLDPDSVDISSFMIRLSGAAASTKASGSVQVSPGNAKVAELATNSGQLNTSSWYNAFLTTQITDVNANPMPVSGKFTFLTAGLPPPPPPMILSSLPVSGGTSVDVSSNLTVTMDRDCSGALTSMTTVISVITASGTVFNGTTTFDNTGKRLFTFDPTSTLDYSKLQYIRVSGIYSTSGAQMTPVNVPYTTMAKPAAPAVASSVPASGSTGFDISSNLTVTMTSDCSGALASMANVMSIIPASGTVFNGTTTFNTTDKRTFTFDPTVGLDFSQLQYLRVSGIYDRINQVMTPVSSGIAFTTAASPTPPGIASTTPASGSSSFNITDNIVVVMDKTCSGVATNMATVVSVKCSGANFPGTVTFNTTNKTTFTFDPTSNLAYSMPSTITVSGIIDTLGNVMTPVTVPFTTADPALNNVYNVSPTITTQKLDSTYYIIAEKRDSSSSTLNGLKIKQVKAYLKRNGSPNTTVKCVIRQNTEGSDTNFVTIGTIPSTSIATSFTQYTFTNLSNTYALTTNDAVGIWADNAALDSSNNISVETGSDTYDGGNSFLVKGHGGTYDTATSQDLAGTFYT